MKIVKIHADVTGVVKGKRTFRPVALTIDLDRTEYNFVEADGDRPTQARVFERVWKWEWNRFHFSPHLVVQDSIKIVEG